LDSSKEDRQKFLGETANALFFTQPDPEREDVDIPAWVDEQSELSRTVPLWDRREVSMQIIERWQNAYVKDIQENRHRTFNQSEV
tara:strand:+ start:322 stop:576 length:255 start_codon:yes stop_codon:yes gene_type:complete